MNRQLIWMVWITLLLSSCTLESKMFSSDPEPVSREPEFPCFRYGIKSRGCVQGEGCTLGENGCEVSPGYFCDIEKNYCQLTCGNAIVDDGARETCDDGNNRAGDGCSIDCQIETGWVFENGLLVKKENQCGNGILQGELLEECDDGNNEDGDGCSHVCEVELRYNCKLEGQKSHCSISVCGDGVVDEGEECDDGNNTSGDGCSKGCIIEHLNSVCDMEGGNCSLRCGNGVLDPGEACDDGNQASFDGCSDDCLEIEPGYTCNSSGTVCVKNCGNGVLDPGEACDDGHWGVRDDGCSDDCKLDPRYICPEPGKPCFFVCEEKNGTLLSKVCTDVKVIKGKNVHVAPFNYVCDPEVKNSKDKCIKRIGNWGQGASIVYDGVVETGPAGEECDSDGKLIEGCKGGKVLDGYRCISAFVEGKGYANTSCIPICGDGKIVGNEPCDDGNQREGDGCDRFCRLEPGWTYDAIEKKMVHTCGNGKLDSAPYAEACDDGNVASGDGCTANCTIEPGYTCATAGSPCTPPATPTIGRGLLCQSDGICVSTCGDGIVAEGLEECDTGTDEFKTNCINCKVVGGEKFCGIRNSSNKLYKEIRIPVRVIDLDDTIMAEKCLNIRTDDDKLVRSSQGFVPNLVFPQECPNPFKPSDPKKVHFTTLKFKLSNNKQYYKVDKNSWNLRPLKNRLAYDDMNRICRKKEDHSYALILNLKLQPADRTHHLSIVADDFVWIYRNHRKWFERISRVVQMNPAKRELLPFSEMSEKVVYDIDVFLVDRGGEYGGMIFAFPADAFVGPSICPRANFVDTKGYNYNNSDETCDDGTPLKGDGCYTAGDTSTHVGEINAGFECFTKPSGKSICRRPSVEPFKFCKG